MLPNVFPGVGEPPAYNTVDAALWYIEAWRAYLEASADRQTLAEVFPVLQEIIAWHVRGTRYGIGMDAADGLLRAGEPGATDLDGRQGRRLGGDAAHRQAGGDQRALVQRLAVDGRFRPAARPTARLYDDLARTGAAAVSSASSGPMARVCSTCWTAPTATTPLCAPTRFSR
jgi:hypothetical protein